jgi:hypothetical protein
MAEHQESVSAAARALATAHASAPGFFTSDVTIPSATAAGGHKLVAVGSDGRQAEAAITVS